jgi:ELWxxDGT repeat protein
LDSSTPGVVIGSTYFFPANDGTNGTELWKSDGTEAGTVMVKNIRAGASGSSPSKLTVVGDILFFSAYDSVNGGELWKSDGTEAGTVMVKDIRTGVDEDDDPLSASPDDLIAFGSSLYFAADDGTNGEELWKSNGTEAGTVMVKDILTGPSGSSPDNMMVAGGTLFFTATDGTNGDELWKSNGTEAGTVMVKDIVTGPDGGDPTKLTAVGSNLYFSANDTGAGGSGRELWKSDGSTEGTFLVKDIDTSGDGSPSDLTAVGSTLFFAAYDVTNGWELWKSDGTSDTTVRVKDIRPGTLGSNPYYFKAFEGKLYFVAADALHSDELWTSDGTVGGTNMVKDINVSVDSYPESLTVFAGDLYFTADDGVSGVELWKSDGTTSGTVSVGDINVTGASSPSFLAASAATLFFRADNGTGGRELWKLASANVTDSPPPPSSGSVYVAPIVVPKVVPTTIRQPTIQKATNDRPARLLGRSLNKDVLFVADSSRLSPEARKSLRQAARLAKDSGGKVAVTGFAAMTSRGSAYEKSVSQKRALAVAKFLRARGFDDWIYYHGLSGQQGRAFGGDPRRVEIRILK